MTATPKTFDEACEQLAREIAQVVIKKQRDYGKENILKYEAFMRQVLGKDYQIGVGVLARLNDKFERLKNLYKKGTKPENEPIEDTFSDIIGYATVAQLLLRNQFKLPLRAN